MASASSNHTVQVQHWLDRLRDGDQSAREALLQFSCDRLVGLTRKMLRRFDRVRRWEQTDDVVQNAMLRLYRTLADVRPESPADYYRLAAAPISAASCSIWPSTTSGRAASERSTRPWAERAKSPREQRDRPAGARADDPQQLALWTEFHEKIAGLPAELRELFDLLWYQGLTQAEVAELLGVSERTIKRRWAAARLELHEILGGALPES